MPQHEDMHQGSASRTDPVGFLPGQMEIHIADKLDYTERSIRALLAHQSRTRDPALTERLGRIREEIQQRLVEPSEQRSTVPEDPPDERGVMPYEHIKDELLDLKQHIDIVDQFTKVARDQEVPLSQAHWRILDAKLDSIMSVQEDLLKQISRLPDSLDPRARLTSAPVGASPPPMHRTIYPTIWKPPTDPGHHICLSKSALGLSMGEASETEIEKQKTTGVSTGVNFSEIDIGSDGPITPVTSRRSFAAQATSPNGLVDFQVQTEVRSENLDQLRPAQWQNDLDSPLSSHESSPGCTVHELRLILRQNLASGSSNGLTSAPPSPSEARSADRVASAVDEQGTSTEGVRPRSVSPRRSGSIGVGPSPPRVDYNASTEHSSSETESQRSGSLSPLFSPLRPSQTVLGSEVQETPTTPAPLTTSLSLPGQHSAVIELPQDVYRSSSLNTPVQSSKATPIPPQARSLTRTPVPPATHEVDGPSPTPSLSSLFNIKSGDTSTNASNPASRSPSLSPVTQTRRTISIPQTGSTLATPVQVAVDLTSPRSSETAPLEESHIRPVDRLFSPFEEVPDRLPSSSSSVDDTPTTASNKPLNLVSPQGTDALPTSPKSCTATLEVQPSYLALSGLDMERSPSVLSDLSSSSEDPQSGQQTPLSEHAEPISSASGRSHKRTKIAHADRQRGRHKRRKTDLGLVTYGSLGSSSTSAGEKPHRRRGRPRKTLPAASEPQTVVLHAESKWVVVEGHPGPYAWPMRILSNSDELSTIQCDKCDAWYHIGCVGVKVTDDCVVEEDVQYICPPCVTSKKEMNVYRKLRSIPQQHGICCRPDCDVQSFSPEKIVGRVYFRQHDATWGELYLIKWLGWNPEASTWEPVHILHRDLGLDMANDYIRTFEQLAAKQRLALRDKQALLALSGYEAIADRCLPYYARDR